MGYAEETDEGPYGAKYCYNAAKSWQLGWYADKSRQINPLKGSWDGKLIGVANYNRANDNTVVIKIEASSGEDNLYVGFNHADGFHQGTVEGRNKVTVVQQPGTGYSRSKLLAKLGEGEIFTLKNYKGSGKIMILEVLKIDSTSKTGYAEVLVYTDKRIPTRRPTPRPTPKPVTWPSPQPESTVLRQVGNNGFPKSAFPLGLCEGDCDRNADCAGDLKCFQRSGTTRVPGCSGSGSPGADYCYKVEFKPEQEDQEKISETELQYVGNRAFTAHSLGLCEGDCDSDIHCKYGLVCYQRGAQNKNVPGCKGEAMYSFDYCIKPRQGQLVKVGNNNVPRSAFPLERCQGDCDSNADCKGNLVCFQRLSRENVPGCIGKGIPGTDYCASPQNAALRGELMNDALFP